MKISKMLLGLIFGFWVLGVTDVNAMKKETTPIIQPGYDDVFKIVSGINTAMNNEKALVFIEQLETLCGKIDDEIMDSYFLKSIKALGLNVKNVENWREKYTMGGDVVNPENPNFPSKYPFTDELFDRYINDKDCLRHNLMMLFGPCLGQKN